ncbi:purine and uridine phosphorylase [Penicillium macrosclerotiorum]|uniref:purine and uridine phosphorylase n=1 Tax=Penicillium macrosclerotiorum TaxID=303699 RepID=UPI002549321D|nr:purine and uridine phosphorylase [Penicillium macrosclerotiorum]KAJ5690411.1 purine and uridine phosphorylase [Penicillium macrosclerotiorum]
MSLDPTRYTVVWFAPLEIEARAAACLFDRRHEGHFPLGPGDDYVFQAGDIGGHNVVIATFPAGQEYGTSSAAALASQVKSFFPNIWLGVLVGVAAGLPNFEENPPRDIRLGDVLVALPVGDRPAIVPYDLGKETGDSGFHLLRSGFVLANTKAILRSAIGAIKADEPDSVNTFRPYYESMMQKRHANGTFIDPGQERDYYYMHGRPLVRPKRPVSQRTRVWYGSIGSGDTLMKSSQKRREIADRYGVIGLEMEAAGILNHIPVAVIRGVCDYGDENKNKEWQPYAAAMAASYTKAVLARIPPKTDDSLSTTLQHDYISNSMDLIPPDTEIQEDDMDDDKVTYGSKPGLIRTNWTQALFEFVREKAIRLGSQPPSSILQAMAYLGLLSIPKSIVSRIIISDFLGRDIAVEFPIDWSDLSVILLPHFDIGEKYGLEKVQREQFIIVYCDKSERRFKRISATNWMDEVQHGRKFYMSAVISHLQMEDQVCTSCRARMRKFNAFLTCPSCGLFSLSAQHQRRTLTLSDIGKLPVSMRGGLLQVPAPDHLLSPWQVEWRRREEERQNFDSQLLRDVVELLENRTLASHTVTNDENPSAPESANKSEASSDRQDSEITKSEAEELHHAEEEYPTIKPDLSEHGRELRRRELEEIHHFTKIFIEEDTVLYDAALIGDVPAVRSLLDRFQIRNIGVDNTWGPHGSPLIAAILSGSGRVVDILLHAGANPFLPAGPLGVPFHAAALLGNVDVLDTIVKFVKFGDATVDENEYQIALDKALYSTVEFAQPNTIPILLHAGANPFATVDGKRSSFAMATATNHDLAASFITEAYGRHLLRRNEAQPIIDAIYHLYVSVLGRDAWLDSCCRNVEMGRTEGVEKRISNRLEKSMRKNFLRWKPSWHHPSAVEKTLQPLPDTELLPTDPGLPSIVISQHEFADSSINTNYEI